MDIIIWIEVSIALFAATLIVTKKQLTVSDRLLSAWLFLLAIDYANIGITMFSYDFTILSSSFFLFNPAFYLYSRSLTDEKFSLKLTQLLHLVPYVFFEIAIHYYKMSFDINVFLNNDRVLWVRLLFSMSFIASLMIYNIISIIAVHKHRMNLKNEFSNINENQRLSWLLFIVVIYSVYVIVATIVGVIGFANNNFEISIIYNHVATLVLTVILGFYGIRQDEIYKNRRNITEIIEDSRYQNSTISTLRKDEIKNLILIFFKENHPYLNSELSMQSLSEDLNIPKHQLTEVLNVLIGKNFFQFVNEYRVNAVKAKLSNPINDKFSLEAIGYDCGFSSKSSFFSVFKNIVGLTPLQFKSTLK